MVVLTIHTLFVILNYCSVMAVLTCCTMLALQKECRMQKLALLVAFSMLISCLGFLIKIEANSADVLITGQKLVYFTVPHAMFLMFLFIVEYCRYTLPKWVVALGHGLNILISVVVLTLDHHPLFYRSYWAIPCDGYAILEKDYGFMHTVAVGLFLLYMAATVIVAVVFSVNNARTRSRYVWRMMIAVALPCGSYIGAKLTDLNNDVQPIAFALFVVMVLFLIYKNNLYDVESIATQHTILSMEEAIIVVDDSCHYIGSNALAVQLFPVLRHINLDAEILNTIPVMKEILDGALSEYEADERIYSITVRDVKQWGHVQGRVVWLEDVTMERKYTKLLRAQNARLESEVVTLSDISYKDELTGLRNRRAYEKAIARIRSDGSVRQALVIAMDINGLKVVNDTIGHVAGDELIRGAADVLREVFSPYGNTFRTGGDEFFAILTDPAESAENLLKHLKEACCNWHGELVHSLSISAGAAYGAEHPELTIDQLMIAADSAMYEDKHLYYSTIGRDRRKRPAMSSVTTEQLI